jgi:hypothetical protein
MVAPKVEQRGAYFGNAMLQGFFFNVKHPHREVAKDQKNMFPFGQFFFQIST